MVQVLQLRFDLANHNLNGEALIEVPAGLSCTVSLAGITPLEIRLDGSPQSPADELRIAAASTDQQLAIRYKKHFPDGKGPDGLLGPDAIVLTGLWHPRIDRDSVHQLTALIPAHFSAVSEADAVQITPVGASREVRFSFPYQINELHFVAGPYVVEEESFGTGCTLASYFFPEDRDLAAEYRKKARIYLERYEALIGPYPYRRFAIVENRLPTGYAMPTFTLLGQVVVRLPFITETSLGHEILHSWFGNAIRVDPSGGNWAEGLTTYLADQAFADEQGKGREFRKDQLIEIESFLAAGPAMSIRQFVGSNGDDSPFERKNRAIGYGKTSMVFHLLRRELGDAAFFAGIRNFAEKYQHRQAGWQELIACLEKSAGLSLADFSRQWLDRHDLPDLAVSLAEPGENDGLPVLDLTIQQRQENPYQFLLPIEILTETGTLHRQIRLEASTTSLQLVLDSPPLGLSLDPDSDLPRRLGSRELPPSWSQFLGATKRLAILPQPPRRPVYAPLIEMLTALGCPIKAEDQLDPEDLNGKSLLFMDPASGPARRLFGTLAKPGPGLSVEVRKNPLAPKQVAVLVNSSAASETSAAIRKLNHYGSFAFLHFSAGKLIEKQKGEGEQGIFLSFDGPPSGFAPSQALPFATIMAQAAKKRVIYVGETHTRYEDHLLGLRVIRAIYAKNPQLAIGMEMFPRSAQPVLDAYLAGLIDEQEFLKESRYFSTWGFDYRLYRDILNFARRYRLPIIALNQEKAIVGKVFQNGGSAGLSPDEQARLPAERDLSLPGYRDRLTEAFEMHGKGGVRPTKFNGFLEAQAIWDETMAESAAEFLSRHPHHQMVLLAGAGHTHKTSGIPPRLARRLPGLTQAVLVNSGDGAARQTEADFVIFSPPASLPPAPMLGLVLKEEQGTLVVSELSPHGNGGKAGILKGDRIVSLDSQEINSLDDLKIFLLYKKKGDRVKVGLKRTSGLIFKENQLLEYTVVL